MHCYFVVEPRSVGPHTPDEERVFQDADTTLKGAIISVLANSKVDAYVTMSTGKEMWDALESKYGVSDAGSELYVMEQFHDYRMVEDRSIVEQAHDIQALVKELENFGCVLPEKFVVGCIIVKLPQTWTDFATSLKHKRQEFSIADLIGSLNIEEKTRTKDV
jgi:transcription elongation factor GreA-like protein